MVRWFLVLFLGGFAALSMFSCQGNAPVTAVPREVATLVLVVDGSASSGDATKTSLAELRCSEMAGVVQRRLPYSKRRDVLVLATGSRRTANEPRIIVPWLRFAPTFKQFGPTSSKEAQAEAFLVALIKQCRGALVEEQSSPIVAAVSRGALNLTSHCTELTTHREVCASRELVVVSDLRETVERQVRERLVMVSKAQRLGKPLPPRGATLPAIALDGNLSVCGLSEHVAGSEDLVVSPEAVVMVWRELLGQSTSFEAACPRWAVPETHDTKNSGGGR